MPIYTFKFYLRLETEMVPDKKFKDDLFPLCLLQSFCELRESATLCDVTLLADGMEIPAHKTILAAASPYFRAMFSTALKEANEDRIEMHNVEYEILKTIVDFFYTSEMSITDSNVYPIMEIADILQVSAVKAMCFQYLCSTLNASNCLSVYVLARMRSYLDLMNSAFRYTLEHFEEVAQEEEFLHLPLDDLLLFLKSKFLNIPSERQLVNTILKWVSHDMGARERHLPVLLNEVNWKQISMESLLYLKTQPLLRRQDLQKQITEAIDKILSERYDQRSTSMWMEEELLLKNSRHNSEQEVLLAIGGESQGLALATIECFTLGFDSWKCFLPAVVSPGRLSEKDTQILPPMHDARQYPAVASREYEVFVVGGENLSGSLNEAEYYSIESKEWTKLSPLPLSVSGAGATILNRQLHVIGGRSENMTYENKAWIYEEVQNCWREVASMAVRRAHHGVVSAFGAVYSIGGLGGRESSQDDYLNSVERYDPSLSRWFFVSAMHEKRAYFGCAAIEEHIYVMGGYDGNAWLKSVEQYSTLTNQWTYVSSMGVPRSSFSTTCCNNRIYCMGGFDGVHYLNTVEKYNPRTNRWHCVHAMQMRRFGLGAATLYVPLLKDTLQKT